MHTCLYTHVPSYDTNPQRDNETIVDSFENDDILEFITEHTKWMPRISMDASDVISLDVAVQPTDLVDSLELNRQLHTTLQRKQDEISALREKNSQLKELARQAEHLAHLLHTMTPSTGATKQAAACSLSSYGLGYSSTEQHLRSLDKWVCTAAYDSQDTEVSSAPTQTDQTPECLKPGPASPHTGVKRCLWPSQDDSGSAGEHSSSAEDAVVCQRDAKRRKDDQELLQAQLQQYLEDIEWDLQQEDSVVSQEDQTEGQKSNPINICGSFQGLQIVRTTLSTDTDSSERGEPVCFKTSIREHSTIRTRVFPYGTSFTSPTPTGGYRFLWIPTEKS
ncbi:hypothetical protein AALO_G00169580 [Alosa alosa]|uniref:Multicilin n=1 Tax=Alosa alosa TaxID=278164 RepID=A0AAV6GE76_9TELE|nr:multicilin [Alosa alosa]KAG5272814.1 hypothetical protein AALO_G00169580 [Alosa alosa]